jgi:hypothetical protein
MTVDALELLGRMGQVEQADQTVLDAALRRFAETAGANRAGRRPARRLRAITIVTAAGALTAAATLAMVTGLDSHRAGTPAVASRPPGQHRQTGGISAGAAQAKGTRTIAAIMTAFSANSDDILMVTKTMRGDFGTVGKTIIWVFPAAATPGTRVRSRIQNYTLGGARQTDQVLTYASTDNSTSAEAGAGCEAVSGRPRIEPQGTAGLRGTATIVDYPARIWAAGLVSVQAATVPSGAGLRACLRTGQWQNLGLATIDGKRVIELGEPGGFGGYERLWVSAATFLPVRLVSTGPAVDTITFAFRFLPPTVANRASLTAPSIPAGFSKVGF